VLLLGGPQRPPGHFHSGIHLANFTIALRGTPGGGTSRSPESSGVFCRVAELVKPAVVSISTTHIEKMPAGDRDFSFGDPFEEFFQQFGGQGNPKPRPCSGMPRQKPNPREFKMEGVGSGVIIDPRRSGADQRTRRAETPTKSK